VDGLHIAGDASSNSNSLSSNFSFRCHRKDPPVGSKENTQVFAVNDIVFNKQHGTFATAGSDGTITYWDKDARTRLKCR
jgi:mRNA export factor